jgi:hypothetical protein
MSETFFLTELVRRAGCALLHDVNNVFVSATNHGFAALSYLADFPLAQVGDLYLAGHDEQADDEGDLLLIDGHDRPVADGVWKLFDIIIGRCGPSRRSSNGTATSRTGLCSKPRPKGHKRCSIVMCRNSCLQKPMPPIESRDRISAAGLS